MGMLQPETDFRMRPAYEWTTEGPPTEFIERLEQVAWFDPAVRIQHGQLHATLSIPDEARHTWSPTLDVQVSANPAGTHVHARVGPVPEVWTFFVFCYAATSALALFGMVLGWSQYTVGSAPWALGALPIWMVVCGLLYGASFVGRGLGAHQIHQILACVDAQAGIEGRHLR
jgi:hypothetical protein